MRPIIVFIGLVLLAFAALLSPFIFSGASVAQQGAAPARGEQVESIHGRNGEPTSRRYVPPPQSVWGWRTWERESRASGAGGPTPMEPGRR